MQNHLTPIHAFPYFSEWLVAATFERGGGVSSTPYDSLNTGLSTGDNPEFVHQNRSLVLNHLGLGSAVLHTPSLMHTSNVAVINHKNLELLENHSDAYITQLKQHAILFSTADCSPVFFADPVEKIAAIAHVGWRGIDKNICKNVIERMKDIGLKSSATLHACIAPSIGPCCYHIAEAAQADDPVWKPYVFKTKQGGYTIDLWQALYDQLLGLGILAENLRHIKVCTSCNVSRFFSYSKSRPKTGRFPSIICLK